jgi:hypothetical protein
MAKIMADIVTQNHGSVDWSMWVYEVDKADDGSIRLHVNTDAPYEPALAERYAALVEHAGQLREVLEALLAHQEAPVASAEAKEARRVLNLTR